MIPNFGNGTKIFFSLQGRFYLFFPKRRPSENKTTLRYDIAWDDTLTDIFHILKNSFTSVLQLKH